MLVTEHYLHNTDFVGERLRYVAEVCSQWVAVDWHAAYGHPVLLAESFVDSPLFRGTCYKASGWTLLGQTQGYRRARQE